MVTEKKVLEAVKIAKKNKHLSLTVGMLVNYYNEGKKFDDSILKIECEEYLKGLSFDYNNIITVNFSKDLDLINIKKVNLLLKLIKNDIKDLE